MVSAGGKPDEVVVWEENWRSFDIFEAVRTQWRIGMAGATGLDYGAVYPLLDKFAEDPKEWRQLLDDVRVMEAAALDAMRPKDG